MLTISFNSVKEVYTCDAALYFENIALNGMGRGTKSADNLSLSAFPLFIELLSLHGGWTIISMIMALNLAQ